MTPDKLELRYAAPKAITPIDAENTAAVGFVMQDAKYRGSPEMSERLLVEIIQRYNKHEKLKNQVKRLDRKYTEAKAINKDLRREISELEDDVDRFQNGLSAIRKLIEDDENFSKITYLEMIDKIRQKGEFS